MSQVQVGQERFLVFWGRKFNKYKKNYPSNKRELLEVIQCIKKWKHILSYHPFKVHMDASTLKYLTKMKNQSGLFTRWYQELAGFNFTTLHKKGKENSNADALNRSTLMDEPPPLKEDEYTEFYEVDELVIKFSDSVIKIQHVQGSAAEVACEQSKDEVWSEVIKWVKAGLIPCFGTSQW